MWLLVCLYVESNFFLFWTLVFDLKGDGVTIFLSSFQFDTLTVIRSKFTMLFSLTELILFELLEAPVYPTSEKSLPTPPAFSMNFPASDAKFYSQHQQQMLVEEYPERPGQPECSYFMKTGDCKYRSGCKFHHPKDRNPKTSSFTVSDQGLPLRPVSFSPSRPCLLFNYNGMSILSYSSLV